jgi:D-alanyl-D-alanine carboxypeptidase
MAPVAGLKPGAHEAGLSSSAAAPAPQARPQQAGDAKPVVVAALPKMRPALRNDVSDTDLDLAGMAAAGRNWTIQIGAYADQAFAKAQLDAYAQKSMDVLGQAARLVVPFQSSDGHTMYRARFGLFAERKAREVCDRLTQRGQTCFAAIAAR